MKKIKINLNLKSRIKAILKYVGAFMLFNIGLFLVPGVLDFIIHDENGETENCFIFEAGKMIEQIISDGKCNYYYPKECVCVAGAFIITIFYIFSLPVFMFYTMLRRKVVAEKYAYLCVLGELVLWSLASFYTSSSAANTHFNLEHTYYFMAPMAIIMLTLYILPPKVLKILTIIISAMFLLYIPTLVTLLALEIITL